MFMKRLFFSVLAALLLGSIIGRMTSPVLGLEVTFHNASELTIDSLHLEFGSADNQSSIRSFRIAPGISRTLALNHSPGMGFNVVVSYEDGSRQEFCALLGDNQTRPTIHLKP